MDSKDILHRLNFSDKEASIYLASLALGTSTASEIAKKSGVQRTHVYDLSKKLIEKGVMRVVKKSNTVLFSAVEPKELLMQQEQKVELLKQSLSTFEFLKNTSDQKPRVSYYEGRSGINQINEDTLLQKDEIVGFTTPKFLLANGSRLSTDYIQKRIQKGIKVRAIGEMSTELVSLKNRDRDELRQTRMLPKTIFTSDVEIGIYSKKVFIIDYAKEFGMIIESDKINHVLKQLFEIVWDSGKIVE